MATQASLDQIQNLYIAFYGRPADAAGQTYWADELEAANGDLTAIIDAFASSEEYDSQYGDLTNEELVNALYQQILGRDAEQEGLDYYVGELEAGNITKGGIALAILDGATGDDAATMANRKEVADAFTAAVEAGNKEYGDDQLAAAKALLAGVDSTTDTSTVDVQGTVNGFPEAEEPVEPGTPGEEFFLTAGSDRGDLFTGTENDDTFEAHISQNPFAGGVSNTLSSADRLDGGAGYDKLFAEIVPEFFGATGDNQIDIQPRTTNIEQVEFEARDLAQGFWFSPDPSVTVDAKHMYGVEKIGSKQSDGDLVIENLTTLANDGVTKRNTSDLTITMDHTDNKNTDNDASDLHVYFDDNYLISGQSSEGQAFYWLLDQDADLAGDPLLDNINVDGIRFSIDGSAPITLSSPDAMAADTHVEFVAVLQSALAALIADGTVPAGTTLTLDTDNSRTTFLDNGSVSSAVPAIVLTTGDGSEVSPVGFRFVEDEPGDFNLWSRTDDTFDTEVEPVSVNVELTKVGRGGEGGDLIVGSKAQLDHGHIGNGIPVINTTVMGNASLPNNLGTLGTTNGALEVLNIMSEAGRSTADIAENGYASLEVRDGFNQGSLGLVNANEFFGDLTLGSDDAITNLFTLTATGGGDVAFYGELTGVKGNFSYTTGAGDDIVDVLIDGDAVDTVDTGVTITTNSGNDNISVTLNADVSQETMWLLENLNINAGAGDDTVEVNGIGLFDVQAGAGSDFVIIDDSDNVGDSGTWSFGAPTGVQPFADRVLYQADITVKFAGFEGVARVNTTAANNYVATQMDINQAIINAIASNPELARLLDVDLDTGMQQIDVTSVVNGLNDLAVSLYQPTVTDANPATGEVVASASVMEDIAQGLIATNGNDSDDFETGGSFDAADARTVFNTLSGSLDDTGAVGTAGVAGLGAEERGTYDFLTPTNGGANETAGLNYSIINMGAGSNDLVVLGSDDDSANTLVIDQTFGKVSVVNFFTGGFVYDTNSVGTDAATVGLHRLDFTQYLSNQTDASTGINGNGWSAVDHAVTLSGATAEANSVSVLTFNGLTANSISFDSLTAANLVAALNTAAPGTVTGGLNNASLSATATTNLVGTTQNHIVLVENAQNQGEYKVFHLTSTLDAGGAIVDTGAAGGDFNVGTGLLGTLDFGYSIDGTNGLAEVNLVGSADYNTAIDAFLA